MIETEELISPAENYVKELSQRGNTKHTVSQMVRIVKENKDQVKNLAELLQDETIYKTCQNIWQFVRNNIEYTEDSPQGDVEVLRTPARTWADRQGDCDCMSILIAATLINLDIPCFFRVSKQERGDWTHIYVVALDNGKEIYMDTVPEIPYFNYEHEYYDKKDFKINENMQIIELGKVTTFDLYEYFKDKGIDLNVIEENTDESEKQFFAVKITLAEFKDNLEEVIHLNGNLDDETINILLKEISILDKLIDNTVISDEATLIKALENIIKDNTPYKEVYFNILAILRKNEGLGNVPTTRIATKGKFDFAGTILPILSIGSGITSQIIAGRNERDNLNKQRELINAQTELERQRLEQARLQAQQDQRNNLRTPPPQPQATEDNKSTTWFKRNWIYIALVLVLFVGSYFLFFYKRKEMRGIRKRRKRNKSMAGIRKRRPKRRNNTNANARRRKKSLIKRPKIRKETLKRINLKKYKKNSRKNKK